MLRFSIFASVILVTTSCCCSGLIVPSINTPEPITPAEFTAQIAAIPPEIQNFQAARYDFPGFANYTLRYEVSDPALALAWVEELPSTPSAELPDEACTPTNAESTHADFSPDPKVVDLSTVKFWQPGQGQTYACLRFPWSHSLLFDPDGKTVYHVIQEIRD